MGRTYVRSRLGALRAARQSERVAPTLFAIWIAARPTLLDAAGITTASPFVSPTDVHERRKRSDTRIQTAAASAHESEAGCVSHGMEPAHSQVRRTGHTAFNEKLGMVLTASPIWKP